jgi:hypothetical protein
MFMAILTLLVAIAISVVAAWYSIVGLMAIFAAAAIPIAIMGAVLEVGKLLTASWLYQNWKEAPKILKSYLTIAVIVLMFITSMGIFGFLSKAHIDQTVVTGDNTLLIQQIDNKIQRQNKRIIDAENVIDQLDKAVQTLIEYDRIRGPSGSIAVRESQKDERASLNNIIDDASDIISKLNSEKLVLSSEQLKLEAEVGPIKYIAALFYEETNKSVLEEAVRWVIITIIFVFDPLAVLLIIAANMSINQVRNKPKKLVDAVDASKDFEPMQAEIEEEDMGRTDDNYPSEYEEPKSQKEIYEEEGKNWLANSTIQTSQTFHGIRKEGKWARNERGVDLQSKIGDNKNN